MTLCRAHALRECGRYAEALGDYDRAAALYRREGKIEEAGARASARSMRSTSWPLRRRDSNRKISRALLPENRHGALGGQSLCQHGERLSASRPLPACLKYYRLAYPVLARQRPLDGHIALFNQAGIHLSKGQPEDALKLLETCQSFFEQQHLLHLSGRAQYSLAYGKYFARKIPGFAGPPSRAQSVFRSPAIAAF